MESGFPMDRLVCGDVGFGKTEVAVRAAFKAVADSRQVAILVPTTILAFQHFNTFSARLADFPCRVDYLSRLKKPSAQKQTLHDLKSGKIDIVIGTHRMLSQDVKFKDLGLLVIDEEQKFGVTVKEKLKKMKLNVDTLTLTATPIPRTLQFSLMGARDLSVINTPPPNRHPILTEVLSWDDEHMREALEYELSRNGQVFFIHNRIENIHQVESRIQHILPGIKTIVAHGKMDGPKLEKIMLGFIRGDFDLLIATTIIESGLDIPNTNTIFINNAHHFGLSDLHQLRGRVGRSNKKAFCYLLVPPMSTITGEARRRLQAIEEFSDLGSGFNIAMQDLDIRGAGNLLGAEQSGFIADIGYDAFQKILDEAVTELKLNEYQEVFDETGKTTMEGQKEITFVTECQIDTDLGILFPESYIRNVSERIKLYRELDNIDNEEDLRVFEHNLIDRFGKLPDVSRELLNIVRMRWIASSLGFEKIIIRKNHMLMHFISNPLSPYYQSPVFTRILGFVQNNPKRFTMKETRNKLTMMLENITSIRDALIFMNEMEQYR
jgi:transcription-repair coupling factor (superfamily II helicase)